MLSELCCNLNSGSQAELQAAHAELAQVKEKRTAEMEQLHEDKTSSAAALKQAKEDLTEVMIFGLDCDTRALSCRLHV